MTNRECGELLDSSNARHAIQRALLTGRTVWSGVYTDEQARRGRAEYLRACAPCHAEDLRGNGTAPSLVEESFSFLYSDTTVGELFGRIRTLMPSDRPNSLSSQSYRDIVAFILQSNNLPPGERELDVDNSTVDTPSAARGNDPLA